MKLFRLRRLLGAFIFFVLISQQMRAMDDEIKIDFKDLSGGAYKLQMEFLVTASPQLVWDVLTDYENIPRFISTLMESKIRAHKGNHLIVEQRATIPLFLWFKVDRRVVLNIEETPFYEIHFTDTAHDQIDAYKGFWRIIPEKRKSRVIYQIHVQIPYIPFDFFSEKSLVEFSRNNIAEILQEVKLRSGKPLRTAPQHWFWLGPPK